nr:polysaccharide deacetylase family protein [Verrucomicrobium spinosum]
MVGYGRQPVHAAWPGKARIAVQFVLNYEEGGENSVLHGDPGSETFLSEIIGAPSFPDRHLSMESLYEYGSRSGVWRILKEFEKRHLPLTVFAVAMALQRHPEVAHAIREQEHEIASHGLRWISYQQVDEATERLHMEKATQIIEEITGQPPRDGTLDATAPIPAGWWWSTGDSSTTPTITAMTSRFGPPWKQPRESASHI